MVVLQVLVRAALEGRWRGHSLSLSLPAEGQPDPVEPSGSWHPGEDSLAGAFGIPHPTQGPSPQLTMSQEDVHHPD